MANAAVWWVRRDLRLEDNQALAIALDTHEIVVPLYIVDPELMKRYAAAEKRIAFFLQGLSMLDQALTERGSRLIVRVGEPRAVLHKVVAETGADAIYAERDVWPYGVQRDAMIGRALPLTLCDGLTLSSPGDVRKVDGKPYSVFTAYSKRWHALVEEKGGLSNLALSIPLLPERFPSPPAVLRSNPLPPFQNLSLLFPPGASEARRRLESWTHGAPAPIVTYDVTRDRLDIEGTSALSPYLRWGMVSARTCFSAAAAPGLHPGGQQTDGVKTWINELVWREFYQDILHHHPGVLDDSFQEQYREIAWEDSPMLLQAWKYGMTGYPVVDACMRQLAQTGWMHNRGRMIVASFLAKDLLIDWREGEAWFMEHLIDADPAANNGGWQWSAGTGADAAPYFRIFNPVLQGKKHDPNGDFVRRWIPELLRVPLRYVHEPWLMSVDDQQMAGCRVGIEYPAPIVEHKQVRKRALAAFATARERYRRARIEGR